MSKDTEKTIRAKICFIFSGFIAFVGIADIYKTAKGQRNYQYERWCPDGEPCLYWVGDLWQYMTLSPNAFHEGPGVGHAVAVVGLVLLVVFGYYGYAERLKDAEERLEELEDKLDRIKIINMEEK